MESRVTVSLPSLVLLSLVLLTGCGGGSGSGSDNTNGGGPSIQILWWADTDGDGFGAGASVSGAQPAPTGWVNNDGDCNDGDPAINPNAEEIVDGVDNDCDSEVDGTAITTTTVGQATTYIPPANGQCGWGDVATIPNYTSLTVAAPSNLWESGLSCGDVYRIRCTGPGSGVGTCVDADVVAVVADFCPGCIANEFDLTTATYAEVFSGTDGRIDIEFERVEGLYGDNLTIENDSGSNGFFLHFRVKHANKRVLTVEMKMSGDADFSQSATHDANTGTWTLTGTAGGGGYATPISIRLTAEDASVLTLTDIMTDTAGNSAFNSGTNF